MFSVPLAFPAKVKVVNSEMAFPSWSWGRGCTLQTSHYKHTDAQKEQRSIYGTAMKYK